jgi:hypothetical protein
MSKTDPNVQNLKEISGEQQNLAFQEGTQGTQFLNDFITGKLPPGQDAAIQLYLNNALAGDRSRFANLGLSGSTMEQSAESYAGLQAEALRAEILRSIAGLGIQEQGLAGQSLTGASGTLNDIISAQAKTDAATTGAIGQFAGALGKGASVPGAGGLGSLGGLFAASDPAMAGTGLAGASWGIDLGALFGGGGDAAAAAAAAALAA